MFLVFAFLHNLSSLQLHPSFSFITRNNASFTAELEQPTKKKLLLPKTLFPQPLSPSVNTSPKLFLIPNSKIKIG